MQSGYTPKDLVFSEDARKKLISGISKMAAAVKSTLGPRGNTVLIESPHHTGGITVTKDGVTVAKAVSLLDPVENLAVQMMKEAADKTASAAGDGTTTAIVLTEAIVKAGTKFIADDINRSEVIRHLQNETKKVVGMLTDRAFEVTMDGIEHVATISANNDPVIGKKIADVYRAVGRDGVVTIERSNTTETYYETTEGIRVQRGYSSPLFINNHKQDECVLEDVQVLVSDIEISNILQIENVLKSVIKNGQKLLIIAPCSQNMINTLAANVVKNNLKIVNIPPPDFGYRQHELMSDIAISVNGTYFSEKTGDDLSIIQPSDLGHCAKVIVGREETIILKDEVAPSDALLDRMSELRQAYEIATKKAEKDFIMTRIASLSGGIGVMHVGGNTDIEQKELYDRVEDAVSAVRSALEEGILPGGGLPLCSISELYQEHVRDKNKAVAWKIMHEALSAPTKQILENAGKDFNEIYDNGIEENHEYDVKAEEYGVLAERGIIDPLKVTRSALENAMSVATTILSTNAIITMARSYEESTN